MLSSENRAALRTIPLFEKVGFEFGDGWFKLLFDLGRKITDYCNDHNISYPKIQQIKEKFGTLRFYYYDATKDEHIRKWVSEVEMLSETICEKCGDVGELVVTSGVFQTVCKNHQKKESITTTEYQSRMDIWSKFSILPCDICNSNKTQTYITPEKTFVSRCINHSVGLKPFSIYLDHGRLE